MEDIRNMEEKTKEELDKVSLLINRPLLYLLMTYFSVFIVFFNNFYSFFIDESTG